MTARGDESITVRSLTLEEMTPELREVIEPRVQRLGYLGDFFRYTGHQPQALRAALEYAGVLRQAVPPRLAEIIVLTVSARTRNRYEQVQHEPLAARAGLSHVEIRALVSGAVSACQSFDLADRAAADLAEAAAEGDRQASIHALAALCEHTSAEVGIGALMMAGHYLGFSFVANALPLTLPVESSVSGDEHV